jgi:hypothetical protein
MKRTILLSLSLAFASFAGEWTGYISDATCGASNANDSAASKECAKNCVKGGAAPVFVVGDKVIKISDPKKVMNFVGDKVKVTGKLDNDTVSVDTIVKAS